MKSTERRTQHDSFFYLNCLTTFCMTTTSLTTKQRAGIVFHGLLVMLFGFFGGMAWLLVLGEYLQFWPLPPIEMSLPENKELWRNAHTGPITNGILALALAGISPLLALSKKTSKWLYSSVIIMIWFNTMGYQISPFTSNRGLNPSGGFLNALCYFSFYIAVFAAFIAVVIAAIGAYKTMRSPAT